MSLPTRALALLLAAASFACASKVPTAPEVAPAAKPAPKDPAETPWRRASRTAREAYAAKDYVAYRASLLELYELLSGHPDVVYKLAIAEASLGHADAALQWLATYADMGLSRDVLADADLASLRALDAFKAVAARLASNALPIGTSKIAFTLPNEELISEDIAYEPESHAFYVSSVRRRKILRVSESGEVKDFIRDGQDQVWSIFALALDPASHTLWATTAAVPQAGNFDSNDLGKTELLQYDLASHKLLKRYAPPTGAASARGATKGEPEVHALTDMTLGLGGEVLVSDARFGVLDVLARSAGKAGSGPGKPLAPAAFASSLETLAGTGAFISPQAPTATADGARVLVPDYARGIAVVERATGKATWLTHPRDVALAGIDGLYFASESPPVLLAIQNGTSPPRVARLYLDAALTKVERLEVVEQSTPNLGEPTHGVVVGDTFYFLANSGWDQLEDDGSVKPGGLREPPLIMRTPALSSPAPALSAPTPAPAAPAPAPAPRP